MSLRLVLRLLVERFDRIYNPATIEKAVEIGFDQRIFEGLQSTFEERARKLS